MQPSDFVAYVGPSSLHDSTVAAVHELPGAVQVDVQTEVGDVVVVEFTGVRALVQNCAVGMLLYALSEMRSANKGRHFVFANADDDGEAQLEVVADSVAFK